MANALNLKVALMLAAGLLIAGCSIKPMKPSPGYVEAPPPAPVGDIPDPVRTTPLLPKPKPAARPGASKTFAVNVVDLNGNAMPAGTNVAFSSDNGTITSDASYVVPDTAGCNSGYAGCPATAGSATFGNILVTMKSDSVLTTTSDTITNADGSTTITTTTVCTDPNNSSGAFKITVTAPSGKVTTGTMGVTD